MIAIQRATAMHGVPSAARLRRCVNAALEGRKSEITLRIVAEAESRALNQKFRRKNKPTNVLSFPYSPSPVVGDLVLCAPVIAREAREQGKTPRAHWAHMVVHGVLHLCGFDHVKSRAARVMERRERAILAGLSFPDPYA